MSELGRGGRNGNEAKESGAYYTAAPIAAALVEWAVPHGEAAVLDPAAGGGAFLVAAAARLRTLGARRPFVVGVEVHQDAAADARTALADLGIPSPQVITRDFLAIEPGSLPPMDAVVGNPPFVRFQRLSPSERARARDRAASAGVRLDPLASSWAAFVVHAAAFLRPGGRLAMVLPSELGHARYARDVLAFLRSRFHHVRFVLFRSALFPHLDQGALLLLADGYGRPAHTFAAALLDAPADVAGGLSALPYRALDAEGLVSGRTKLQHAWLPDDARELLGWLRSHRNVSRLGDHARVMIGYVTGANGYFHLAPEEALDLDLAAVHLRRALFRSRALQGLAFQEDDWRDATERGDAGLLFAPSDDADPAVAAYLAEGERRGLPRRAKARHRTPWYRVTRTGAPDLVMTAMTATRPRIAVNDLQVAVCNTLLAVWRRSGSGSAQPRLLAAAALSSLTELSAELEGNALGGGLLKFDPSAAQAVLLPVPRGAGAAPDPVTWNALDRMVRAGDAAGARAAADATFVSGIAGVGPDGAEVLARAADMLRALRHGGRSRRTYDAPTEDASPNASTEAPDGPSEGPT